MEYSYRPIRHTERAESLIEKQDEIYPGELIELVDPEGGPSRFVLKDRSGHLHEMPFSPFLP
jgi:hypothetical protein